MEPNPFASPSPKLETNVPPQKEMKQSGDVRDVVILIFLNVVALVAVPAIVALIASVFA